jgi:hypothetical protein
MAGNTAPFHGMTARAVDNATAINYTSGYDLTIVVDTDDISRQGQAWKENLPGQASWSGSIIAQLVAGNTEQKVLIDNIAHATAPGTVITDMKFYLEDSGDYYAGSLILTSQAISANVGGHVSITWGFIGHGAVAITVA